MNQWILGVLVVACCMKADAHDGGVSELNACLTEGSTTVTWTLHDEKDAQADWFQLATADKTIAPSSFQRSGHHHVRLEWHFQSLEADGELSLTLPGLSHMPYGHRVLASNCDQSRRAVLSQWQQQWIITSKALSPGLLKVTVN